MTQRHCQRFGGAFGAQTFAQVPADDFVRVVVRDQTQIAEVLEPADVGNVTRPKLIRADGFQVFCQVWILVIGVIGVGGFRSSAMAVGL